MGLATARCLADDGAQGGGDRPFRRPGSRRVKIWPHRGSPDAVGLVADVRDADQVDTHSPNWGSAGTANSTCWSIRRAERAGQLRRAHRRPVARGGRRRRAVDGALRARGPAAAAQGRMGAHRELSAHSTQRQSVPLAAYAAAKAMVTSASKNFAAAGAGEILVNVVSPGTFVTPSLVDWARSVGIDSEDPYGHGGDRLALRPPGPSAPRGPTRGDRAGRGLPRVAPERVHDRRERQCGRWILIST